MRRKGADKLRAFFDAVVGNSCIWWLRAAQSLEMTGSLMGPGSTPCNSLQDRDFEASNDKDDVNKLKPTKLSTKKRFHL